MAVFYYEIKMKDGSRVFSKKETGNGKFFVVETLPENVLERVWGQIMIPTEKDEKIFVNGYQSWTHCPERRPEDSIKGVGKFPKALVDHYGMDRYGDYYFRKYPERSGILHGMNYCYFRRGDHYRLVGSLDERPGYTMLTYDSNSQLLNLDRDCSGVHCGGEFHAFDLFFAEGTEKEVFDAWFDAMGVHARTQLKLAGYSSWYNRYENITQGTILEDLYGCKDKLAPGDIFQVDDGWEPAVGDWLAPDERKFSSGMKAIADEIHKYGLRAGLWLAPFVAAKKSSLFAQHPDWLLQVDNGPWYCGCNWGGFYSLDLDNPGVTQYLEQVFDRVLNEWGYDLVKLDFLYGVAPFGTPTESRAARMTRGLEFLRKVCGEKLILGCGVPLMPAFGLVDYCRIGCDVGLDWDNTLIMRHTNRERVSTRHSIENTIFRRQLNGRAFLNDPDVFFLREDNIKLDDKQKRILGTVNSLFGGVLFHSDNMAAYTEKQDALYTEFLKNRGAEDIRVENEKGGLVVKYRVDGKDRKVKVE